MRHIALCVCLRSLTGALDHRLQHPVALVPSPPERQRLVLIEELLQVGGRGGMGSAEVEGAIARVALWIICWHGRADERLGKGQASGASRIDRALAHSALVSIVHWRISCSLSPCSKTTGFLSASACLISIWQ